MASILIDEKENTVTKYNVDENEFILNTIVGSLDNILCPKVLSYDKISKKLILQKINGMSVSDFYGDDDKDTPIEIYNDIRIIISELLKIGICYQDITGYNFIKDKDDKIWVIDFGHAYVLPKDVEMNYFVKKFLDGFNGWNPDFK